MIHLWDEFSKSLAKPAPRRELLRWIGLGLASATLSPLGASTAWAKGSDPCKSFCKCSSRTKQNQCLSACRACSGDTARLCGSCGNYVCCGIGATCCGNYCGDLANDVDNCGACGYACEPPGPYEYAACIDGYCEYACEEGAADCGNGICTPLWSDPDNCGACGNVCGGSTPYCNAGVCSDCPAGTTRCGDVCSYLPEDPNNCGACGIVCPAGTSCLGGFCQGNDPPSGDF